MITFEIHTLLKKLLNLTIVAVLITGCQQEFNKIKEPDKTLTISAGDTVADLVRRVVLKDGSFDNIIDKCSAISIQFPYSIQIDEQVFQINTSNDVDWMKQNYLDNWEDIEVVFPVTVIYNDYSESEIYNEDEMEVIQQQYNVNLDDEDIECLDFVYPVDLCLYNTTYQNADCITANNDFELFKIFENINDTLIELGYPLQLKTLDDNLIPVSDNVELKNQLLSYINSCDENDEVEFETEEDSTEVTDNSEYIAILTSGDWNITLYSDSTDKTSSFDSFLFDFNSDFTLSAITDAELETETDPVLGIWEINIEDSVKLLKLEFNSYGEPLDWLSEEWEITTIDDISIIMQTISDSEIIKKLNLSKTE